MTLARSLVRKIVVKCRFLSTLYFEIRGEFFFKFRGIFCSEKISNFGKKRTNLVLFCEKFQKEIQPSI